MAKKCSLAPSTSGGMLVWTRWPFENSSLLSSNSELFAAAAVVLALVSLLFESMVVLQAGFILAATVSLALEDSDMLAI